MALLLCHQCDKPIADTAPTCPHCGAPQDDNTHKLSRHKQWRKAEERVLVWFLSGGGILGFVIGIVIPDVFNMSGWFAMVGGVVGGASGALAGGWIGLMISNKVVDILDLWNTPITIEESKKGPSSIPGFLLLIVFLAGGALGAVGCYWWLEVRDNSARTEERMRQNMIGTWKQESDGVSIYFTFHPNGHLAVTMEGKGFHALVTSFNEAVGVGKYEGTWSIRNSHLFLRINGNTNASAAAFQRVMGLIVEGRAPTMEQNLRIGMLTDKMIEFDNGRKMQRIG